MTKPEKPDTARLSGNNHNDLTSGSILGRLLSFSLPFLISIALQALYGAVDMFVVGRYVGTSAVAAVNIGVQVMQMLTCIILGMSVGTTVSLGRHVGAKNDVRCASSVANAIIIFGLLAAVMTPVILIWAKDLVHIINTPVEAVAQARIYLMICGAGLPFIAAYNIAGGIFRGLGNSKLPMYSIGVACLVNVVCDLLFVGVFGWGVAGAALATIFAQASSAATLILYLVTKKLPFPFNTASMKLKGRAIKEILAVGIPVAFQDLLIGCAFMAVTIIANRRGLISSSAVGIVERLMMFTFLVPSAMLSSLSAITAQNIGAGKHERAVKSTKIGMLITLGWGLFICGLCQIIPRALISIFTKDASVIIAGEQYLRSYIIDVVLVAGTFCMNGYLTGSARAHVVFIHNTLSIFLVRIPLAYLMSIWYPNSLLPMGLASPLGTLFSLIFLGVYIILKRKKRQSPLASYD